MLSTKSVKSLTTILCLCLLIAFPMTASADRARSGIRGCGGNHAQRTGVGVNEDHTTSYTLRNFNVIESIEILGIVIVDGNGTILFDGLPGGTTFKPILGPVQSTTFNTNADDVLGTNFLPKSDQPIQTYILWRTVSGNPADGLRGGLVRRVRDSTTGAEISRHSSECKDLDLF
jgi:hypothetical protein